MPPDWSAASDVVPFLWLCVFQLSEPAKLNAYVQPAPLPEDDTPALPGYTTCKVSGWGVTHIYSYFLSPVLRAVDVQTIPYCHHYYYWRITDNMMCAGSRFGGKDSCQVQTSLIFPESNIIFLTFI